MQTLDSFYETSERRGYYIKGKPLVVAEWNYNQIFSPTVTNPPDDQNWSVGKKFFLPEAVANGLRPTSGISAAFTGDATTAASDNSLGSNEPRFYTVGDSDAYRYWICPTPSDLQITTANGTSETDDLLPVQYSVSRGTLLLEYPEYVNVNKVVATFNLGPIPLNWSLYLHIQGAPGDGYVEITNSGIVNDITGKFETWWNGTIWSTTQSLDVTKFVIADKIKLVVRTVSKPQARLQVIQLSAGREIDISDRLIQYQLDATMDTVDFIHPIGLMDSNSGSMVFQNYDLEFDQKDKAANLHGLTSGRCQYRIYVQYDLTSSGGGSPLTRIGTMYSNDLQQDNEYEYTVELFDIFKILQTTNCPARLFEDVSIARIISQILDSVGVDLYRFNASDFDPTNSVKYFWTDGTQTVFDVLSSLCQSQQCALFVDELGFIQLLTKSDIINSDDTPIWTFRGEKVGLDIADIETLSKKYNLQANEVTIKYKQMQATVDAADITEQPLTSKVWQSSDTVVLRATPIVRDLTADGLNHLPDQPDNKDIWIQTQFAETWPYAGRVNIDGEIISYEGKGYIYWDHTSGTPVATEVIIKSQDEKKKWDTFSWNSASSGPVVGGVSTNPSEQNGFNGRLVITQRDADGADRQNGHYIGWNYGWFGMKGSVFAPSNPSFPTRYMDPGGSVYNVGNLKDVKNRTNWTNIQSRWSVKNSMVTCDNNSYPIDGHIYSLLRDLGDTEYREMGMRFRLNGWGQAGLVFYLSNATGYDNSNPTLTDPLLATRWYQLDILSTEAADFWNRTYNEISLSVKNGNTVTVLKSIGKQYTGSDYAGGQIQINKDTWYDLDIIFKDGQGLEDTEGSGMSKFEVYIDGKYIDTWVTLDNIRPTGLVGIHTRHQSKNDFQHFYATTTTTNARPTYDTEDLFDFSIKNLPPGTGKKDVLDLPVLGNAYLQGMISFATTDSAATISSLKIKGGPNNTDFTLTASKEYGPITLQPNTRMAINFTDIFPYPSVCQLQYTSTQDISVCVEATAIKVLDYALVEGTVTPDTDFFDVAKFGYLSTKAEVLAYANPLVQNFSGADGPPYPDRKLFFDDFGATAHEIRDFDVQYDTAPAKGVSLFISNENIRIIDYIYNPERGKFTLVNVSNDDQIVNGTQELDSSNSIDQTLMLFGYVLQDKGDKTKVVTDDLSVRRYGKIAIDLDANWVFNEDDATELGNWITSHWSDPMDTIELTVFSNSFSQIGDKVNIIYTNAAIDSDWLYIISGVSRAFDENGFLSTITVRRVR